MNLLKRLFSIGSKKNKKERTRIVHNVPIPEHDWSTLQVNNDQEHEAAVGRLLRSSSARCAQTPELNYANLPPLPHPINKVVQTPASSTVSLASTSLSQRGTYNVTLHKRTRHTSTEFPNANRDLDDQQKTPNQAPVYLLPAEDSRVLRLRSDPSVASLLELYDEHGKLSSNAFSNSPPTSPVNEGRAQCRRNGSTLRQLLGAPSVSSRHENDSSSEVGDISWADRFLAETESASSASSPGLRTPDTPRAERERDIDISFNTDGDLSGNAPENPAISSMEVELSMTTDISQGLENLEKNHPYMNSNPSTPQRASQVFGFLTRGKQSKPVEEVERSLPELPSAFSSPSDENVSCDKFELDNSSDFTFAAPRFSAVPTSFSDDTSGIPRARSSLITHPPFSLDRPASQELRSTFSDDSHDLNVPAKLTRAHTPDVAKQFNDVSAFSKQNDIKVLMNGPTKVIVTAPTPSTNREASRIPKGPRSFPQHSSSSIKRKRSALLELSNSTSPSTMDPFIAVPSRRRTQTHHRSGSQNSTSRMNRDGSADYISKPIKLISTTPQQKENQLSLSVREEIPATPLRSNTASGSRSLFRSVVHQGMFQPPAGMTPSPASSSEMSPVGRQMMMDVRQQRLKARETDREKSGKRFRNERNGLRI